MSAREVVFGFGAHSDIDDADVTNLPTRPAPTLARTVSFTVTDCAGADWKMSPTVLATAVVAATAGRAKVEASDPTAPNGLAALSTSSALTAAETLNVGVDELCALAPLEPPIASMKSPTTADAPRAPRSLTNDLCPMLAGNSRWRR